MKPDVSIVLPCRNEAAFIDRCVASILAQELDGHSMELIVADGMSDDGTREKLALWEAREPRMRVVDNPGLIVPTGLNATLEIASAPVIVRMDAHSTYPNDYVANCLAALERSGAHNAGGIVLTLPRGNSVGARVVQAVSTHWFGVGGSRFRIGAEEGPVDTVPFGCFRREVFDRIGLFDERLTRHQDYEFNARIRAAGGVVWLDPNITIDYYNQATVGGLFKQAFLSGRWNTAAWYLAPYAFRLRHVVPGVFVSFIILGFLAASLSPLLEVAYVSVLIVYACLALFAGVQQAKRLGAHWLAVPLPLAFAVYHISYGAGIVLGAVLLLLGMAPWGSSSRPWANAPSFRIKPLPLTARDPYRKRPKNEPVAPSVGATKRLAGPDTGATSTMTPASTAIGMKQPGREA